MKISEEEFKSSSELKQFILEYEKTTTILHPTRLEDDLDIYQSKMGGKPYLNNFSEYPKCDVCKNHLNFVIQLFKLEYPEFFFPKDYELFQLFRCPNKKCKSSSEFNHDLKMFVFYQNLTDKPPNIDVPNFKKKSHFENLVPPCKLNPQVIYDYPNYDDHDSNIDEIIETKYGEEWVDYLIDNFSAKYGTKFNGYPSWIQAAYQPECKCGNRKEFFFQLSSEEFDENNNQFSFKKKERWSPHEIMIGDTGNIYFFTCKICGIQSIETYWDCY